MTISLWSRLRPQGALVGSAVGADESAATASPDPPCPPLLRGGVLLSPALQVGVTNSAASQSRSSGSPLGPRGAWVGSAVGADEPAETASPAPPCPPLLGGGVLLSPALKVGVTNWAASQSRSWGWVGGVP